MSAGELPACVHGVVQWALAVLPCEPIQTMCSTVASAREPCCQRQRHYSTHAFRRANACAMRTCCQCSVSFWRCPIREPLRFNRLHMCILGVWDEYFRDLYADDSARADTAWHPKAGAPGASAQLISAHQAVKHQYMIYVLSLARFDCLL